MKIERKGFQSLCKRRKEMCFSFPRIILLSVGLIVLGSPLYGRGENEAMGPVTLTIAGRDGAYGDAMQLAADKYKKMNPNVSFEILKLSGSSLFEKTVVDLKGNAGTYDLILIDDPNVTLFQQAGWLEDLGAVYRRLGMELSSDFVPTLVKLGRYPYSVNGKLYALPIVGNVELFAYRKDLFKKHGLTPPATWDAVLSAAQTLSRKEPKIQPVLFRGSKGNPIVTGFLPLFWAFGGKVLDGKGQPSMNQPEALAALKFYLKLAEYAPEGVAAYQSAQVKDAVYSGVGAMAIEVWPGWIKDLDNPDKSRVVGRVVVTKHPAQVEKSSPMIGVWLAAIPKASRNKSAAFDFLQFLTSEKTQEEIADATGVPPTRASVHQNVSLATKYPWYPAQLDGLQNGVPRPRTTKWKEIEDVMGTYLQLALLGDASPESALSSMQKKIAEIVQ